MSPLFRSWAESMNEVVKIMDIEIKHISIVIPVYNVPLQFLKPSLDSVLGQEGDDIEILIIDDGSAEECRTACDEYAKKDSRVKVIHQENMGSAASRNAGLNAAKGEYIIFVDADDLLVAPSVCRQMYDCVKKEGIEIGFFNYVNTFNKNVNHAAIEKFFQEKELTKQLQLMNIMQKQVAEGIEIGAVWSKIFKRSFLSEHQLKFDVELRRTQDRAFLLDCLTKNAKIKYFDLLTYEYTLTNKESVSNKYNSNAKHNFDMLIKRIKKIILDNYRGDGDFKIAMYQMCCKLFFDYLYTDVFNKENQKRFKERYQDYKRILADRNYKIPIMKVEPKEFLYRQQLVLFCIRKRLIFCSALLLETMRYLQKLKYRS